MIDANDIRDLVQVLGIALGMFTLGVGIGGSITASRAVTLVCADDAAAGAAASLNGVSCAESVTRSTAGFAEAAFWAGFLAVLVAGVLSLAEMYSRADIAEVLNLDN